jgi:hypothetical protein
VSGTAVRELTPARTVLLREDCAYFINPGSVDASRKRHHKFAEFAVFDSAERVVEFFRISYNEALTETKALAAGYRLNPLADRFYDVKRRLLGPRARNSNAA